MSSVWDQFRIGIKSKKPVRAKMSPNIPFYRCNFIPAPNAGHIFGPNTPFLPLPK